VAVLFASSVAASGLVTLKQGGASRPSYGQLAADAVVPYYEAFIEGLKKFTDKNEPGHVKDTRGPCADFRTLIDIFSYAYPNATGKADLKGDAQVDVYLILLADLTEGHNVLGKYSDLGSVPYTKKEKEHLLKQCLDWKEKYLHHSSEHNFPKYIRSPANHTLYFRPKHELSGHFWKHVPTVPSAKLDGLQNIALLQ